MNLTEIVNSKIIKEYTKYLPEGFYSFFDENGLLNEDTNEIERICKRFEKLMLDFKTLSFDKNREFNDKLIITKEILKFAKKEETIDNIKDCFEQIFN